MAESLNITVNGEQHEVQADPDTPLLYVLRNELQLNGAKFGCGLAQCGACTVLDGDDPIRSCVTPVSSTEGPITTIEGLGTREEPHPLQQAFIEEDAAQCGYCIPGMVMSAEALFRENSSPSGEEVRSALEGNLCRCGTHIRILRAIDRAAQEMSS